MRVWVQARHRHGPARALLDRIAEELSRVRGVDVVRTPRWRVRGAPPAGEVRVVWNGRWIPSGVRAIYCELGWIPKWTTYQISWGGINARHHAAGLVADEPVPIPPRRREGSGFFLAALQREDDANVEEAWRSRGYRTMQDMVRAVGAVGPALPVVWKQHPRDGWAFGTELWPGMRREDRLLPKEGATLRDILSSGECRAVVAVNSNSLHEALAAGVPGLALGRGMWPDDGTVFSRDPNMLGDLGALDEWWERHLDRRGRYLAHLLSQQWRLDDVTARRLLPMLERA